MNIILTLCPTINCKITICKYNFFIKQAEQRKLLVSFNTENIFLQVFPIDSAFCFAPYIVMLNMANDELTSESDQIEIIKISTNNYHILITPKNFTPQKQSKIIHMPKTNTTKDLSTTIILNGTLLTILQNNNPPLCYLLKTPMHCPKMQRQNNCYIIYSNAPTGNNLKQVAILNPEANKIKFFYCNHFRLEDGTITLVTELKDYAHHIKVLKLSLNTNLEKLESYVGVTSPPKIIQNPQVIPYAFLQNIKAKDFKEAHKYLNANFSQSVSNNALVNFFGAFHRIATPQIKTPPFTACLIYKNNYNASTSRYFKFKFDKGNKIENIEEVYPPFKT